MSNPRIEHHNCFHMRVMDPDECSLDALDTIEAAVHDAFSRLTTPDGRLPDGLLVEVLHGPYLDGAEYKPDHRVIVVGDRPPTHEIMELHEWLDELRIVVISSVIYYWEHMHSVQGYEVKEDLEEVLASILADLRPKWNTEPHYGAIALCSKGGVGRITSETKEKVYFDDTGSIEAWTGLYVQGPKTGQKWCSRNPQVIIDVNGHVVLQAY